jgi:hypothetical protein
MPELLKAFRTGAGVPYASYGEDAVEAQAALNRPAFVNELAAEWIPQIPDVAALLADSGRATRLADVGCALGWAAIELAKAYPHLRVDGYDTDEESITRARRNAADAGVSNRVTFDVVDASSPYGERSVRPDLVLRMRPRHAHPVEAIGPGQSSTGRRRDRDRHGRARGRDTQRRRPDVDILRHRECDLVPPARSGRVGLRGGRHSERPSRFRSIARTAGWSDVEILRIDHPFWRFYRLIG